MKNEKFSPLVEKAVRNLAFESLNPMQLEMLKSCRKSRQILLFSPTGSGKTVAFLLPILEKEFIQKPGIKALILVPTRELALQIEQVFRSMSTGLKVSTCYGGHKVKTELNNLIESPTLLIGTPGRIAYHLEKGNINPKTISLLILDEYDKSLEYGFAREISSIVAQISDPEQLILTSATKSNSTVDFIDLKNPVILDYSSDQKPAGLEIRLLRSEENEKLSLLMKLLSTIEPGLTLVFCNHREAVDRISLLLNEKGVIHDTYHGGYEQFRRERALIKFRNGSTPILVTTDLASRGLDITGVKNIIHYQTAASETVFIHRNGRTARMDNVGTAWIILSASEKIPEFISGDCIETELTGNSNLQIQPFFSTLYFGAGKKDKISKADIVGSLIQIGGLKKEEIGLINILDYESFAAIPATKAEKLCSLLSRDKIKNKKVKIALSN